MQIEHKQLEDNVLGKYYVTDACNGCGLCFFFRQLWIEVIVYNGTDTVLSVGSF